VIDFVQGSDDLSQYDLVVVPSLFVATESTLANLARYTAEGGHLLVTYQTGITDERARITQTGYLGELQKTLGIRVEEFAPLAQPDQLGGGASAPTTVELTGSLAGSGSLWSEYVHCTDAVAESTFASGPLAGWPAITRSGRAWYAATLPDPLLLGSLVERLLTSAGVRFDPADASVERVQRGSWSFEIDHTTQAVRVIREPDPAGKTDHNQTSTHAGGGQ
jgi:beta-galactosidase